MTIDPPRAGIFGWPISHSKSPRLHGYWLKKYGLEGSYEPIASSPEDFESDLRRLAAEGWRGVNVTIPHKETALALADEATDRARAIGAANTIVFRNGEIHADNTDAFGFSENIESTVGPAWNKSKPALILGAGGAARAIIWALLNAGIPELRLTNRTRQRAEALAAEFGDKLQVLDWSDAAKGVPEAGLIVNTTSLGMKNGPALDLDLSSADPTTVAHDIVYSPLETPFLKTAAAHGLKTVDGLGMLLHQGRPGFEAWFGVMPEVDEGLRKVMLAP